MHLIRSQTTVKFSRILKSTADTSPEYLRAAKCASTNKHSIIHWSHSNAFDLGNNDKHFAVFFILFIRWNYVYEQHKNLKINGKSL